MSASHNQFELLTERRFAPFFWTQFLGAFNDNVYKNAVMILLVFEAAAFGLKGGFFNSDVVTQLGGALFILPFLLFSATSGQLADKYDKIRIIRLVKVLEIGIMLLGTLGFWLKSLPILLGTIFLLGLHSTLFGPVKYAILPQQLRKDELMGGNGLVEMGTFIAILLGEILGGFLIGIKPNGWMLVSATAIAIAITGYLVSRQIPSAPAPAPDLKVNWNPITETFANLRLAAKNKRVLVALIAASWFWFYGTVLLTQLLKLPLDVLHGDEHVVTLLLAIFSVGVGVGSAMCEKLSGHKVEIGLVPLGAIGLTLFGLEFYFALSSYHFVGTELLRVKGFLQQLGSYRILIDLFLIGFSGGLFIVPLYALMQSETEETYRSRIIANNNILNALFMVASAIYCVLILRSFSIPQLLGLTAVLNAVVCIALFWVLPDFGTAFCRWLPALFRAKSAE